MFPHSAPREVLFICSSNADRSIMAEAILRASGAGYINAHSAGLRPTGTVNSLALRELGRRGYPTDGLSSKPLSIFLSGQGQSIDHVIFLCRKAASAQTWEWSATQKVAIWDIPEPSVAQGSDQDIQAAFAYTCDAVERAIRGFCEECLLDQGIGTQAALSASMKAGQEDTVRLGTSPSINETKALTAGASA
ncbi:arsenate reductase ArsC [Massilia sp. LXY-6]|uniref:arsenate reductase/protein-tyrosine-phosphatase family protein n=1 Tax=Massilia sp. LXY-6 TaxID=3379823 RepID=UPI003EE04E45